MEQISLGRHLILSREKKFTKSNVFWNTENKDGDISTMWHGKGILYQKHHGNQSRYFQTTATSWPSTNLTIIYDYSSHDRIASLDFRKHEYGANVSTEDFPETSFPLLLQFTYQNIQTINQRNVELLWVLFIIFPRWIPPPHFYWTFLTSPWQRNEFCSFNWVFLIPSFDRFTVKLLVPFS